MVLSVRARLSSVNRENLGAGVRATTRAVDAGDRAIRERLGGGYPVFHSLLVPLGTDGQVLVHTQRKGDVDLTVQQYIRQSISENLSLEDPFRAASQTFIDP